MPKPSDKIMQRRFMELEQKHIGKTYGRWTIGKFLYKQEGRCGQVYFECTCSCGNVRERNLKSILKGDSKSCGCYGAQQVKKAITKYFNNEIKSKEYRAWHQMKTRCYNHKIKQYKNYGGRGIRVCDRWLGDDGFSNFLKDMGNRPSPKHSLDRFPNNDGNYEPNNCRWATKKQQARNTSTVTLVEYKGEMVSLSERAKKEQVPVETVCRRYRMGVRGEKLFYKGRLNYNVILNN